MFCRQISVAWLVLALLQPCVGAAASTTNYSDQWWIEQESGWGASVLQQADVLFVDVFVYGEDRLPTWYTSAARYHSASPAGHDVFTGDLFFTSGPWFGAPWTPEALVYRKAGTLTFDASGAGEALLILTVDGVPVVKAVTRQLWRYENLSGSYYGGWTAERASCTPASANGRFEASGPVDLVHGADNAVTLRMRDQDTGEEWLMQGRYAQSGHLGEIAAATADGAPTRARLTFSALEKSPAGFTGRFTGTWQSSAASCAIAGGRIAGVRR